MFGFWTSSPDLLRAIADAYPTTWRTVMTEQDAPVPVEEPTEEPEDEGEPQDDGEEDEDG